MYLSHPVRRIREDPIEGETIALRVTAEDEDDADDLADRIRGFATVEQRLRFGGLRVVVDQTRLDTLCALDGIESIETANTVTLDAGDAGEDVVPED